MKKLYVEASRRFGENSQLDLELKYKVYAKS